MECLIRNSMVAYMLENRRFGFVPKISFMTQQLSAKENLTKWLDGGKCIDIICLDFQKAFD